MNIAPDNKVLLERSMQKLQRLYQTDAQLRELRPLPEAQERLLGCTSVIEFIAAMCEAYSGRPALGSRAVPLARAGALPAIAPEFTVLTYAQLWERVRALASGWQYSAGGPRSGELVGLLGLASPEYAIADFACQYLGAATSSLATDLPEADLVHLINEGEMGCLVVSWEELPKLARLMTSCPAVRELAVIDFPAGDGDARRELADLIGSIPHTGRSVAFLPVADLMALGTARGIVPYVVPEQGSDPLRMLCYTSGSTGFPKGAIFKESLILKYWRLFASGSSQPDALPLVSLCFYPLNHIMGRFSLFRVLALGGTLYFTPRSDMSTLFDDMRLVRPVKLDLVPRVAEMIYQHYHTELALRSQHDNRPSAELAAAVMAGMRSSFLGDRLLVASIGSAPSSPEVRQFISTCFDVPLTEGYGMTEIGGAVMDGKLLRPLISAYKLVDVPELGYRVTDKPYPRGALCVKSELAVAGYYKSEEATQALFDEEGYLKTGDIFEERGPDQLVYIDREKNILKLSQGEFVTVARIEALLVNGSPFFKQIYLYGNSSRAYLVGVVVPERDFVASYLGSRGLSVTQDGVRRLLMQEMNRIGKEEGLRPYEVPRDIVVEDEPFSADNGLLTSVGKNARTALKRKYQERLEALYEAAHKDQLATLASLAAAGRAGQNIAAGELVAKALEAVLGGATVDVTAPVRFQDVGADSLAAISFSQTLQHLCGIQIEAGFILSPTTTLPAIVQEVDVQLSRRVRSGAKEVSFADIHGEDPAVILAEDLRIERFIGRAELDAALHADRINLAPRNFLLTGATGWLGRFLCLELLENAAVRGGKVVALVRAADEAAAMARLTAVYASDGALARRFASLAREHLMVVAGDLARPQFGLTSERYKELALMVDAIVHAGALVNHVYPYTQLFAPNVLGTVEVIRFALFSRLKAIHYVSTIGVVQGRRDRLAGGDDDVRSAIPSWHLQQGAYAQGYAISKWAGEVLLHDLREQLSIPISIVRPSMIMPHSVYRGQVNVPDMISRFLASIVYTGIAPASFYREAAGGARPHFDGLPGDFIARVIVGIATSSDNSLTTYHASNPHLDDGVSLDSFVAWIRSAGYKVSPIADYAIWAEEFGARLRALSDTKKRFSSLPILQVWSQPGRVDGAFLLPEAARFRDKAEALGLAVPHLTEAFIHKYLSDLALLGVIDATPATRAESREILQSTAIH